MNASYSISNEMILASAGSGKTYQLTLRFLGLLVRGVAPANIIALTFTRKAAGEFLERILMRLTEAADSESDAGKLARELEMDSYSREDFRDLLHSVVNELGHLNLRTIDSFFYQLVNVLALELGLPPDFIMMDPYAAASARDSAIEKVLHSADQEDRQRLLQLFKESTWGAEEKQVFQRFQTLFEGFHELYLENRDVEYWGQASRIWDKTPWWYGQEKDWLALIDAVEKELPWSSFKKQANETWMKLIGKWRAWTPGSPFKDTLFFRLLEARDSLKNGYAEVKFGRATIELDGNVCKNLYQLLAFWMRMELSRRLTITQGSHQLLARFESTYDKLVRERGKLVFSDLGMRLRDTFSGKREAGDFDIFYRLDRRFDHWLLDEFQDTSRMQWSVLNHFIDEVIQDTSGRRSFFYVGDVKQAIYRWRGGDTRLFKEIYHYYNQSDERIRRRNLAVSWRSAQPIIDAVNTVFGDGDFLEYNLGNAGTRWKSDWKAHAVSSATAAMEGHAAWIELSQKENRYPAVARLLQNIDPVNRGLSCGVLVRTNSHGRELTRLLRNHGIATSLDGEFQICTDNGVGRWVLAAFQNVAHPSNRFSRDYLDMGPLGGVFVDLDERLAELRRDISTTGMSGALARLLDDLEPVISTDPFLSLRSRQLREAVMDFEMNVDEGLDPFLVYLENYAIPETSRSGQVQVMTVHKAKGLDFDVVIIPDLDREKLKESNRAPFEVFRKATGETEWILSMPAREIAEQDPVLAKARNHSDEEAAYEALCVLYVAMTRARKGLYWLTEPPPRNSSGLSYNDLFQHTCRKGGEAVREFEDLGRIMVEWGEANADFRASHTPGEAEEAPMLRPVQVDAYPDYAMPVFAKPPSSQDGDGTTADHKVLSPLGNPRARQRGLEIHRAVENIDWLEAGEIPEFVHSLSDEARDRVIHFLNTDLAREIFQNPGTGCRLWREKPYMVSVGDQWERGVVDRVHIYTDDLENPVRAQVFDFKTDIVENINELENRYAPQINRYRTALARLLDLPESKIEVRLVQI